MKRTNLLTLAAIAALTPLLLAYGIDPQINSSSMFGLRLPTGSLWRYDFSTSKKTWINYVRDVETGQVLTNVRAAGYFNEMPPNHPGFQQIHAFWLDPADSHSKVLHVDIETAEARLTGIDLGEGTVTGAEAVVEDDGIRHWHIYGLQSSVQPPQPKAVEGMANLNPNNSPDNEFNMVTPGKTYTRDDLHKDAPVNEQGVLYSGPASSVYFKPKGNGNQNSLILNGEPYYLSNGKGYEFTDTLTVTVFNDHVKNTKAMGHWWIGIDAQTATVTEDGTTIVTPPEPYTPTSSLFSIHTETGLATTIFEMGRQYNGLASNDGGETFYAVTTSGILYRIDPVAKTETAIGSTGMGAGVTELEFVGSTLYAFDTQPDRLFPIDTATGAKIGTGANLSLGDIGGMVFMPNDEVPAKEYVAFD